MSDRGSALVDLIRDFLLAQQSLGELLDRHREGGLRFADVTPIVGDDRASLLFRLKERSHALFRAGGERSLPTPREAFFDLAVGSLFHEAMKVRENLYQSETYAPRVRSLQERAGGESDALFRDFEKMLRAADERLEEALHECEELLGHTRSQFRLLLVEIGDEPLVARTLYSERGAAEGAFSEDLDAIFASLYGRAAAGYALAARSYLASAYFDEAIDALAQAARLEDPAPELARLGLYAEGMQAFQAGDFDASLESLEAWVEAGRERPEAGFVSLALSAMNGMGQLVDGARQPALVDGARALARRLDALAT